MGTVQIKIQLSILHRRGIADMLPEFTGTLSLDTSSGRTIAFTPEQAEQILHAIRTNKRPMRSVVKNGLKNVEQRLIDLLEEPRGIGAIPVARRLYQFKVTLLSYSPIIWRRIQIKSCTLDRLHEHIQTAMGWTNSHLHQFLIDGERWGDYELLDSGFDDDEPFEDSLSTKLDLILPKSGERFAFTYEYDFGDCWMHEVLSEGCLAAEKGKRYPVCIEGENSCPPEDVGGVGG